MFLAGIRNQERGGGSRFIVGIIRNCKFQSYVLHGTLEQHWVGWMEREKLGRKAL